MKISTHLILQILLFVTQYGNIASGYVPMKYVPIVALIVSGAQGALAWYNHYYTPTGIKIFLK